MRLWRPATVAGNDFLAEKQLALLKQQADFVAQQKAIARLEAAIARFKLWASIVVNERHIKQPTTSSAGSIVWSRWSGRCWSGAAWLWSSALEEFPGTMLVVSHDRYFRDRVADRIFEVADGELRVYAVGYSADSEQRERAMQPSGARARIN